MMRPRLVRRLTIVDTSSAIRRPTSCTRAFANQSKFTSTKSRPNVPFLSASSSSSNPPVVRYFTSQRKGWLKHEAKMVARYTIALWGAAVCVLVVFFAINEEVVEREFPTPHEWHFLTRKFLRDANSFKDPKNGEVNWARALELARGVVIRLQDPKLGGQDVVKLSDHVDPSLEVPDEFVSCDISAMSEEWRRGYFEAIMLAAKAAEHVDGWVRDLSRNVVSPPEFVIGPSNPHPIPILPGNPHAPREEDCEIAYPSADSWYMKILATKGLTSRQKMQAALEYASFMEFKNRSDGPQALYQLALAEATQGSDSSNPPYNPKTYTINERAGPPSMNLLDALTAMATYKARKGDLSGALPIYLSVLKARRALSNDPPRIPVHKTKRLPVYRQVINFFAPPDYPSPPPDGSQPPWRSTHERCHEASLNVYIGEILYATSARADGLAWTRDGVDLAEEQLRSLGSSYSERSAKQTCRECLGAGLGNWATMVSKLAKVEEEKKASGSHSTIFSFWGGSKDPEDRWTAEQTVVQERVRRTREIMEDVRRPSLGLTSIFQA